VKSFLSEGAIVHFCSRTSTDVESSVEKLALEYPGNRAIGAVVNASDPSTLKEWVASCASQSGRIDVVIANVSAFATRDTPEQWQSGFSTDIMSTVTLFTAALPELKKTKGNVITISVLMVLSKRRWCTILASLRTSMLLMASGRIPSVLETFISKMAFSARLRGRCRSSSRSSSSKIL
jgi:NAD(P)-dependent dehydrogenase (short-subunit alcohol dehydrogenase family)